MESCNTDYRAGFADGFKLAKEMQETQMIVNLETIAKSNLQRFAEEATPETWVTAKRRGWPKGKPRGKRTSKNK